MGPDRLLRTTLITTLPHKINHKGRTITFSPISDSVLPGQFADDLLKTYPRVYEEHDEKTKIDLKRYTFSDAFKNTGLSEILTKVNDQIRSKVLEFARGLASGKDLVAIERGTQDAHSDTVPVTKEELEDLTVAKLKAYCTLNDVPLPDDVEKKAEIIDFILKDVSQ